MNKDTMLCIRITSGQKKALYRYARMSNMTISEYGRNLLFLRAKPFPKYKTVVWEQTAEEEE